MQTDKTENHSCGAFKEDVEGDDLTMEEISMSKRLFILNFYREDTAPKAEHEHRLC